MEIIDGKGSTVFEVNDINTIGTYNINRFIYSAGQLQNYRAIVFAGKGQTFLGGRKVDQFFSPWVRGGNFFFGGGVEAGPEEFFSKHGKVIYIT